MTLPSPRSRRRSHTGQNPGERKRNFPDLDLAFRAVGEIPGVGTYRRPCVKRLPTTGASCKGHTGKGQGPDKSVRDRNVAEEALPTARYKSTLSISIIVITVTSVASVVVTILIQHLHQQQHRRRHCCCNHQLCDHRHHLSPLPLRG